MSVFILCPECNEDLGEIFQFFQVVKTAHCEKIIKNSSVDIDVDNIDLKPDFITGLDFIFKALRINNQCCRMHILGNTDFDDLYY